jgi:hypothetical protein
LWAKVPAAQRRQVLMVLSQMLQRQLESRVKEGGKPHGHRP